MTRPTVKQADAVDAVVAVVVRELVATNPEWRNLEEDARVRDQLAFALRDMVREEIAAAFDAYIAAGRP